jgi:transposase
MKAIWMCQAYYVQHVTIITSAGQQFGMLIYRNDWDIVHVYCDVIKDKWMFYMMSPARYGLDSFAIWYIIRLTHMKRTAGSRANRAVDAKSEALRQTGALHPNPEDVHDEAFRRDEFFDPRDLVQVRYEMLRRHQIDGDAVTDVSSAFGVSRQAYYMTEAAFETSGIAGLMPRRRGPQRAHKCTDDILDFVEQWRADISPENNVSEAVRRRFGVAIHPRSLARALTRRKKKQQ